MGCSDCSVRKCICPLCPLVEAVCKPNSEDLTEQDQAIQTTRSAQCLFSLLFWRLDASRGCWARDKSDSEPCGEELTKSKLQLGKLGTTFQRHVAMWLATNWEGSRPYSMLSWSIDLGTIIHVAWQPNDRDVSLSKYTESFAQIPKML